MAVVAYCTELSVEVFHGRLLPSEVYKKMRSHSRDFQLISAYRAWKAKEEKKAQEKAAKPQPGSRRR